MRRSVSFTITTVWWGEMPVMGKIRLGGIGCGNIAGSHFGGLTELSDVMEVTVVCDIILQRAQQAAARLGIWTAVADYKQLVDEVDAVLISLPHDLHFTAGMYFWRESTY
jgi:predicted dehydrogenase